MAAGFRAIENGMPMLRAARAGTSVAADPCGRVIGLTDHFVLGARTMTAEIPIGWVPTLYARVGDVFAWLCVAALVGLCLLAIRGR